MAKMSLKSWGVFRRFVINFFLRLSTFHFFTWTLVLYALIALSTAWNFAIWVDIRICATAISNWAQNSRAEGGCLSAFSWPKPWPFGVYIPWLTFNVDQFAKTALLSTWRNDSYRKSTACFWCTYWPLYTRRDSSRGFRSSEPKSSSSNP